jgi:hypothetical protein
MFSGSGIAQNLRMKARSLGLFITLLLAGCPAMTPQAPQGAAPVSNERSSDVTTSGDGLVENEAIATKLPDEVAATPKPQPGGISALPGEPGDKTILAGEVEIEPMCRLTTGPIRYRVHGTLQTIPLNGEIQPVTSCSNSMSSVVIFQFWNGNACQTRSIFIRGCKFDTAVHSEEMNTFRFYNLELSQWNGFEEWHGGGGGEEESQTPTSNGLGLKACKFGDVADKITTVVKPVPDGLATCSVMSLPVPLPESGVKPSSHEIMISP